MKQVKIELVYDFICPWCYIAKSRLNRVIHELKKEVEVQISLSPFILYPNIPIEGVEKAAFAKKVKYGMGRNLKEETAKEAIVIDYRKIKIIPNSLKAHRLVGLLDTNKQFEFALNLSQNYFENGMDLSNDDLLIKQAKTIGISQTIINQFINTEKGKAEVKTRIEAHKAKGITVVPTIKFSEQLMIPGLLPFDVLEKYIRRAVYIQ